MGYYRKIDPTPKWMLLLVVLFFACIVALMLTAVGCAPAKDSHKQFHRQKYRVQTERTVDGQPAVVQRWWSRAWFWQPRTTKRKTTGDISPGATPDTTVAAQPIPRYNPSR